MNKQKTSFRSAISRAILVLGAISLCSTWLPNQARADDYNDEQPKLVGDQYAHAKINQLKSYGWQVKSDETADGQVTFTATKSDPKTGETTQATYHYTSNVYSSSVEHTFKDGSKTSEQSKGNDDDIRKDGVNIDPARTTKVSTSTTDPSGNQMTKVYDGGKVVATSQFDSRFNTTTTTNVQTGNKTITTPNSERIIGPTGKNIFDYDRDQNGTTTAWSFDANGNVNGRTIKRTDGTTQVTQKVADGSFASVTTDSKGTVISKQFCNVPSNCVYPTSNQNQQNLTAKPQGLTATGRSVNADVLNQIQGKSKGGLKGAKAKSKSRIKSSSAGSKGTGRSYEFSKGNNYQPQNNSTKNYKAKSKSPNWKSSAGSKGTGRSYEFSKGNSYQPQNNSTKNYNTNSKAQNWNSSAAGSQGTGRRNLYKKH